MANYLSAASADALLRFTKYFSFLLRKTQFFQRYLQMLIHCLSRWLG